MNGLAYRSSLAPPGQSSLLGPWNSKRKNRDMASGCHNFTSWDSEVLVPLIIELLIESIVFYPLYPGHQSSESPFDANEVNSLPHVTKIESIFRCGLDIGRYKHRPPHSNQLSISKLLPEMLIRRLKLFKKDDQASKKSILITYKTTQFSIAEPHCISFVHLILHNPPLIEHIPNQYNVCCRIQTPQSSFLRHFHRERSPGTNYFRIV